MNSFEYLSDKLLENNAELSVSTFNNDNPIYLIRVALPDGSYAWVAFEWREYPDASVLVESYLKPAFMALEASIKRIKAGEFPRRPISVGELRDAIGSDSYSTTDQVRRVVIEGKNCLEVSHNGSKAEKVTEGRIFLSKGVA